MRSSSILLVAVAAFLVSCEAVSTTTKSNKLATVADVMKTKRFLRTTKTDEEEEDDDGDLDSKDEERADVSGIISKTLNTVDDTAATAAKKLRADQLAKLKKANPTLLTEKEAVAAAKSIERQWMAQITKTDAELLKDIKKTPGAAENINRWREGELKPLDVAKLYRKEYPGRWVNGMAEKEAWRLYTALYLRQYFSLRPTVVL